MTTVGCCVPSAASPNTSTSARLHRPTPEELLSHIWTDGHVQRADTVAGRALGLLQQHRELGRESSWVCLRKTAERTPTLHIHRATTEVICASVTEVPT